MNSDPDNNSDSDYVNYKNIFLISDDEESSGPFDAKSPNVNFIVKNGGNANDSEGVNSGEHGRSIADDIGGEQIPNVPTERRDDIGGEQIPNVFIEGWDVLEDDEQIPNAVVIPNPDPQQVVIQVQADVRELIVYIGGEEHRFKLPNPGGRNYFSPLEKKCIEELYFQYICMGGLNVKAIARLIHSDIYENAFPRRPEYIRIRQELQREGRTREVKSIEWHLYHLRRKLKESRQ